MLTALAVVSFMFANAQDGGDSSEGYANGDIFISGSFGYNSETEGDRKNNTFAINPRLGFFVADNIAVGGKIGYQSTNIEPVGGAETKINGFTIGAFGRYYFTPANKFSVYGEFGVDYVTANVDDGTDPDVKSNGFNVGGGPGVSYFLSSNFALEATWGVLQYRTIKPDFDGAESQDNFDFGVNLDDINLGLVYKF